MWIVLGIVVAFVVLYVAQRRTELFLISVRGGRVLLVRGRCPGPLFHDLRDAITRQNIQRASVSAVRTSQGGRLAVSGMDDFAAQRLRNIFQTYPVSNFMLQESEQRRTWTQLVGIVWISWLLESLLGGRHEV